MSVNTNSEVMDFGSVVVPERQEFLAPGHYWLSVSEAKFVQPTDNNQAGTLKTAYLEVTFAGEKGRVIEKFYVSPKEGLMKRLQFLHHGLTGKDCSKPFKSIAECGKYYETLLNDSRVTSKKLAMVVGAKEDNKNRLWACLPYLYFIIDADLAKKSGFEEQVFEVGSTNYINNIQKNAPNASHKTDDVMLPASASQVPDTSDDLPF